MDRQPAPECVFATFAEGHRIAEDGTPALIGAIREFTYNGEPPAHGVVTRYLRLHVYLRNLSLGDHRVAFGERGYVPMFVTKVTVKPENHGEAIFVLAGDWPLQLRPNPDRADELFVTNSFPLTLDGDEIGAAQLRAGYRRRL